MACMNRRLSVLSYANGFTVWHYEANDPIETVMQDGYFDTNGSLINAGDVIYIVAAGDTYCRVFERPAGVLKLKGIK